MENLMIETQTNGMVPIIEEYFDEGLKGNIKVVHNLDFTQESDGTCQVFINEKFITSCEYENLSCELYQMKIDKLCNEKDYVKNLLLKYS